MEPFKAAASLVNLSDPYPSATTLLEAARNGGEQARVAFARLWLSEGIPFAFRKCPAVYESVRSWLSIHLDVHAKEISLTGSARLGSSLAPWKVGKPFEDSSDLDLFVVSDHLFRRVKDDFLRWAADFDRGVAKPRNDTEAGYWSDNSRRGYNLIQRGFLDAKMIPNLPAYTTARTVNNTMSLLVRKLKVTVGAPKPNRASVRCYSSWNSYVQQVSINLG